MEPGTFFSGERLKRVLTQNGLPLLGFTLPLGMYLTLRGMVLGNPLGSYVGSSLSQRFAVHPILNPLYSLPFAGRWKTALVLGGKYIGLHLWPNPLLADYSFDSIPLAGTVLDLRLAGTIITLIGMATAIWFLREQAPLVSAGLFFWLGGIFFFSNLFFTFGTIFAERLMYLPSIGFCIAVASAGWAIGQKFPRFSLPLAAIGLLTVTFSVWQCHHHTLTFRDSLTTIRHLLEQGSPRNAWAWSSLGNELAHNNRASEATAAYEKSLAILPNPEIYDTLATTYASLNQWDKSVQASQNAVKMAPEWWPFRKRLAVALTQTGHTEEAMREFGIALQAAPQDSLMQLSLASLLKRKGDWARAETHYLAALAGDHPLPVMWRGLGDTYVAQGKQDQAQTAYENFLKTNPPRPEAEKVQEQLNRSRKLAPEK
ncbi:MAG: tetratricopeptide repeat protein [Blastocatellia bacterium]|nr:tetratricopeptide repeat protein [Blastocatellia bacterium]